MNKKCKRTAALLLLIGAVACGQVDFQGQDLRMHRDLNADSIDLELTYHGVMAPETKEGEWSRGKTETMKRAVETIHRMANGERYFTLLSPLCEIDLDKYEALHRAALVGPDPGQSALLLKTIDRFSIARSEVYLDEQGRLTVRQRIHIKGALEATREFNRSFQAALLQMNVEVDSIRGDAASLLDAETLGAWIEEARLGVDWIRWEGQTLVLRVPMNPASAARLLRAQVRAMSEESDATIQQNMLNLIDKISEIQLEDGHLTLRIQPDPEGFLSLQFVEDGREYRPALVDQLRSEGFPLPQPTAQTK